MNRGDAETEAGVALFAGRFGQRQVDAARSARRARVLTVRTAEGGHEHLRFGAPSCSVTGASAR